MNDEPSDPFLGGLFDSLLGGPVDENAITDLISPVIARLISDTLGAFWISVVTPIIIGFAVLGFLITVAMAMLIALLTRLNRIRKSQDQILAALAAHEIDTLKK